MKSDPHPWNNSSRILILIPHPDDEVVGCYAAIERAQAEGRTIFGLVLTTGIPAREILWPWKRRHHALRVERRRQECMAVVRELGFADIEYSNLATRRVRTKLAETLASIESKIAAWEIDTLWTPAYEGGHHDHDATNLLCSVLAVRRGIKVFEYAEYNYSEQRVQSQTFIKANGSETILQLSEREITRKRRALAAYTSAQTDLNYVLCEQESLRPLQSYDYSRPAHPGTLFLQRFHWVFFRHPSIDFTTPKEACKAYTEFLAAQTMQLT